MYNATTTRMLKSSLGRNGALLVLTLVLVGAGGCRDLNEPEADGDIEVDSTIDAGPEDSAVDAGPRQPLDIISWNIRDFPRTSSSVQAVSRAILDLDVDVVGIQEIAEPSAFVDLVRTLSGYDGVIADDPDAYLRVGLVFKTDRIELVRHTTIYRDDWYAFPRPPLVATLNVLDPDGSVAFDFTLVVVHLKASVDDESEERRRLGCEQLQSWLTASVESGAEEDIIIIGDWNDELTDRWADNVFTPFLELPDQFSFLTLPLAEDGAYSYIPFRSFLDHILVTASALDEYGQGRTAVLALEQDVAGYQTNISDHRPVRATFELP